MLKVEDWAEIRRLHRAEKQSIKEIVRRLGVSRNTVRAVVRADSPPEFKRVPRPSAVDPFAEEIRRLLAEHPRMPTTVIAERIGWVRGMTILKDRVRELRPLFVPPDRLGAPSISPGSWPNGISGSLPPRSFSRTALRPSRRCWWECRDIPGS